MTRRLNTVSGAAPVVSELTSSTATSPRPDRLATIESPVASSAMMVVSGILTSSRGAVSGSLSASTVMRIAKAPRGESDISDVLCGTVLALDKSDVRTMLAVFAGVAVAHVALGKRFFELTYRKGSGE